MKIKLFILLFVVSFQLFAQKSEKIKASKMVTITKKELKNFKELELWNKLDVLLIKGLTCQLEIEADDNLHETFEVIDTEKKLRISNNARISGAKKMLLKITYNDSLQSIIVKDDVKLNIFEAITNPKITISSYNDANLKLSIKNKNTIINCNDSSELEMVIQTDDFVLNSIDNSKFKGSISSRNATINLMNKSSVKTEGTVDEVKLSSSDSSSFYGKNLVNTNAFVNIKNKSEVEINCKNKITLNAINNSKIELYGSPKIDLQLFEGEAIIQKRGF